MPSSHTPFDEDFFRPGTNCCAVEDATRVSFMVDGAEYFYQLRETLKNARRSVLIIGWDINSEFELVRTGSHPQAIAEQGDGLPTTLGQLLDALVDRRPDLHVHVLNWDFSLLYAEGREWFTQLKMDWTTHPNVIFRLDSSHPPGGSQHQKMVVVDDRVAFVGGLDITRGRWDTPGHLADDRRRQEQGEAAQPFHDVQMAVEGDAARAIGRLARERWQEATGETLADARDVITPSPWPSSLPVNLEQVPVAISRTLPRYRDREPVQEIQALMLDAINSAETYLYLENQYLTADCIADALEKRLRENGGPEIVVVLPYETDGWLSRYTMDVLRERVITRLSDADHENRLRIYFPFHAPLGDVAINVHAKVLIADDHYLRIGSANYNNRSMGLDSECDLALVADGQRTRVKAIARFCNQLLAEHLGVDNDTFAAAREHNSLITAIEQLEGNPRTLKRLDLRVLPEVDRLVPPTEIIDPEQPIDPEKLVNDLLYHPHKRKLRYRIGGVIALLAVVAGLTAAWRWTPLNQWLDLGVLLAAAEGIKNQWYGPLAMIGSILVGGLVGFPITLLIAVSILIFGPVGGSAYAMTGVLCSALSGYSGGFFLGRRGIRKLAGKRLQKLSRQVQKSGLLGMVLVRVVPVAPFIIVNLVVGALHVRLWHFMLGTFIGFLPGTLGMAIFADRLAATLREPDMSSITALAAAVVALALAALGFRHWLRRRARNLQANA